MNTKDKHEGSTLTIVEAVETLSRIADMDLEHGVGLVKESERTTPETSALAHRNIELIPSGDPEVAVKSVRETFRVVLNYLHNFYEKEYHYVANPDITEGIKTIMVLVGEAAKKLDKFTTLFHHHKAQSVTEFKEYRRLQEFYLTRIAHKVDEGVLGKWIMALTQRVMVPKPARVALKPKGLTSHVFVDLDGVKKDSDYDLFFIRKEDGTRFFNPRLIRNIKLVCDFGDYFGESRKEDDPLDSLIAWQDHFAHVTSKQILKPIHEIATAFYRANQKVQTGELGDCLSKALIALMLSSDPQNQLHDFNLKSSLDYLKDFQHFVRQALHTREYQRLLAYPPKKTEVESAVLLELTQALCRAIFLSAQGDPSLVNRIAELVKEAAREVSSEHAAAAITGNLVWNRLASEHAALVKLMKRHPSGPLFKVLDLLENGSYNAFDPISQNNIPHELYSLYLDNRRIQNIHLPAPIYQEFIQKATVIEEFKAFIRSLDQNIGENHLLFNLQDRTSWREHARCVVLEDLQKQHDFSHLLTVVTLAKDTEFYNQTTPYQDENHADIFIKHFKDQLSDENCGFYFPPQIKEVLFPEFIDEVIRGVHRVFFSGKNVLLREHRLNFIELVYQFIEMKIIEIVRPTSMSFTCKDGVDIGSTSSAELLLFLKLISRGEFTEHDFDQIDFVLYEPSIVVRERLVLPERFQRLVNVVKTIEQSKEEFGGENFSNLVHEVFGLFYNGPVLNATISN